MYASIKLKSLASRLLTETKLVEFLQSLGKVEITGSFKYDLMVKPDIDIHIYNPQELETSLKLIQQIIKEEKFKNFTFQNFLHKTKPHLPFGIYISLIYKIEQIPFNIDLWIIKSKEYYENLYRDDFELIKKLENKEFDPIQKELMLSTKKYILENNLNIKSMQIYNAILNYNLKSIDEVINFNHQFLY